MSQWTRSEKIGLGGLVVAALSCPLLYQIPQVREWVGNLGQGEAKVAPQGEGESGETLERWKEAQRVRHEEQIKAMEEAVAAEREEARRHREERDALRKERIDKIADSLISPAGPMYRWVNIRNLCKAETQYVAIRYLDLDDVWVTKGWWEAKPGSTTRLGGLTRNRVVYLYAKNGGGSISWSGDGREGARHYFVSYGKPFVLVRDEAPLDEKMGKVWFFRMELGSAWGGHEQGLRCREVNEMVPAR